MHELLARENFWNLHTRNIPHGWDIDRREFFSLVLSGSVDSARQRPICFQSTLWDIRAADWFGIQRWNGTFMAFWQDQHSPATRPLPSFSSFRKFLRKCSKQKTTVTMPMTRYFDANCCVRRELTRVLSSWAFLSRFTSNCFIICEMQMPDRN